METVRMDDPLLGPVEAGAYLGEGEWFARRLIARREVAVVRIGRKVKVRKSELDRYCERRTTPANPRYAEGR